MIGRSLLFFVLVVLIPFAFAGEVHAGFFEMPEITQMPELERKSLLTDLDIPSVRERDPDPNAGPRLNVLKFKLEGIVEYPELGITKKDIEELIEGIRFDLMDEYKILESGFTAKELEEVSKLLVEIEEETQDRHVSELELQKLVWLVREQRSNRGVTLGQIETVADRITRFYRERGFILAKAYIPRQEVRDGIVTLTLLLGKLGEVEVHDNALYRDDEILNVFADALTLPVTAQAVEENLYLLNDFPGLAVTGFFEPGSQVGDTRLNLNVRNESNREVSLRVDNHGSELTGEYRFYGQVLFNNLAGNADQLQLAGLYAVDPENLDFYQLRYSSRAFSPRLTLSAGYSENDFVIGPGNSEAINALGLFGKTLRHELSAHYRLQRSRTSSYYLEALYEDIESQLRIGEFGLGGDDLLDDRIHNLTFNFSFDVLNEQSRILHQGALGLVLGDFVDGAEEGQDESYWILRGDYSLMTFWNLPWFDTSTRVVYRASLQYTDSALSSINQFSLATPTRLRAYESGLFSADQAFYNGVDWVFNAPDLFDFELFAVNLAEVARPFVFLDAGWGKSVSLVSTIDDETATLLDAGLGLQFSYRNRFQGNLQLAFPLAEDFSADVESSGDTRLVFDFQYNF